SVNRPAIYELRDTSTPAATSADANNKPLMASAGNVNLSAAPVLNPTTTLGDVLEDAGGLTSVAGAGRGSLERLNGRADRAFDEFPIDPVGLRRELKDGDVVRIYPVSPKITNSVTLRGNVAQPGRYMWHEGMRVSDLIPSRDMLITRQYWNSQNAIVPAQRANDEFGSRPRLYRRNGTSIRDQERLGQNDGSNDSHSDRYNDVSGRDLSEAERSTIDQMGGVGDQSSAGLRDDQRRGDANLRRGEEELQGDLRTEIKHRGSEINWEHAVIERLNKNDLTTDLIPFNLGLAIDQPSSMENQRLQAGDVV